MSANNYQTFEVDVKFLEDDRSEIFNVPINVNGKWLFDEICKSEGVYHEKEYFGLRFIQQENNECSKTWIDLSKSIHSQLKYSVPKTVSFRVKHYPENPLVDLKLPKSQYLLYRQIKRDLKNGRLIGPRDTLVMIAALIAQVELGDYSVVSKSDSNYLKDNQILHSQPEVLRNAIVDKHKTLEGLLPSEVANTVLQYACVLDTYGVDPIRVKEKSIENHRCFLGLNHKGILEFLNSRLHSTYEWNKIDKMYCDKKKFIITTIKHDPNNKRKIKREYEYKCKNTLTAATLWNWAEDSKIFFTIEGSDKLKPVKSKRGLFSRSRTFTYSGRTRNEILNKHYNDSNLPSNEMIELMNKFGSQKHLNLITNDSSSAEPVNVKKQMGFIKRPDIANLFDDHNNPTDKNDFETESVTSKQTAPGNFADNRLKYSTLPGMVMKCKENMYDTIGSGTIKSIASTASSGNTLQHWQMASFFDLPQRKFIPEAKKRQNKLISIMESDEEAIKTHLKVMEFEKKQEDFNEHSSCLSTVDDSQAYGCSLIKDTSASFDGISKDCTLVESEKDSSLFDINQDLPSLTKVKVTEKLKTEPGKELTFTSEDDEHITESEALKIDAALSQFDKVISEASNERGWFNRLFTSIKGKLMEITGNGSQSTEHSFKMQSSPAREKHSKQIAKKSDGTVIGSWVFTASLLITLSVLGFVVIAENDVEPLKSNRLFKSVETSVYGPLRNLILFKTS